MDKQKGGHFSSFDFIGGEDSGEDSDELYDSDQISEMEEFAGSFHESGYSDSHDDTNYARSKEEEGIGLIISHDDDDRQSARAAPPTPLSGGGGDHGFHRNSGRGPASSLRSRGVQKMGRNIGKAVGGGISKVGRSILHVGKSQVHNNGHAKAPASGGSSSEPDHPGAASLLAAGFSFSSESQVSKNYVCGYLHKISDGKWSKRSWHRRWFVLDRQNGVLSYYRHNPANLISAAPHGNIVHMEGADDGAAGEMLSPAMVARSSGQSDVGGTSRRSFSRDEAASARESSTNFKSSPDAEQQQSGQQQQNLLYLCKTHPWYRGEFDLNVDNVSLLFEKSLAKSAPTSYFFQVSTLSLHEIDSKRGVQYKVRLLMRTQFGCSCYCALSDISVVLPVVCR